MTLDPTLLLGLTVGLVVFQVHGVKKILNTMNIIGLLSFALGLSYIIVDKTSLDAMSGYIVRFIEGNILASIFYLIGANISRWLQFGKMSSRIVFYLLILYILFSI